MLTFQKLFQYCVTFYCFNCFNWILDVNAFSYWQDVVWKDFSTNLLFGKQMCFTNSSNFLIEIVDTYTNSELRNFELCGSESTKTSSYFPFLVSKMDSNEQIDWPEVCAYSQNVNLTLSQNLSYISQVVKKQPCSKYSDQLTWNHGMKVLFFNWAYAYGIVPTANNDLANAAFFLLDTASCNFSVWYMLAPNSSTETPVQQAFAVLWKKEANWTALCGAANLTSVVIFSFFTPRSANSTGQVMDGTQNCLHPSQWKAPSTTVRPRRIEVNEDVAACWQEILWGQVLQRIFFDLYQICESTEPMSDSDIWLSATDKFTQRVTKNLTQCSNSGALSTATLSSNLLSTILSSKILNWTDICENALDVMLNIASQVGEQALISRCDITQFPTRDRWFQSAWVYLLSHLRYYTVTPLLIRQQASVENITQITIGLNKTGNMTFVKFLRSQNSSVADILHALQSMNWTRFCFELNFTSILSIELRMVNLEDSTKTMLNQDCYTRYPLTTSVSPEVTLSTTPNSINQQTATTTTTEQTSPNFIKHTTPDNINQQATPSTFIQEATSNAQIFISQQLENHSLNALSSIIALSMAIILFFGVFWLVKRPNQSLW